MTIDWTSIQKEYITTDISYRQLADKYGLPQATLSRRAKKEKWVEKRRQHDDKVIAKSVEKIEDKKVEQSEKIFELTDKVIDALSKHVEENPPQTYQSYKLLAGAIKDLKEIKMIKSEADLREQEARIQKLQKEAKDEEQEDTTVIVKFQDDIERYGV